MRVPSPDFGLPAVEMVLPDIVEYRRGQHGRDLAPGQDFPNQRRGDRQFEVVKITYGAAPPVAPQATFDVKTKARISYNFV